MGEKYHRERLARTLRVPEYANLAVAGHRLHGSIDRLPYREILVVGGKNLDRLACAVVEANEVLDDVKQTIFSQHTIDHGFPSSQARLRIVAIS